MMMVPTTPPLPPPLLLPSMMATPTMPTQSYDAGVSGSLGWCWQCDSACAHIRRALACICMRVIVAVVAVVQSISHCCFELMHVRGTVMTTTAASPVSTMLSDRNIRQICSMITNQ